ncbi:MAG: hypothetical protein ACI90U_001058 [Pseudomonadales bacterium]|jgi:hypothetical protein
MRISSALPNGSALIVEDDIGTLEDIVKALEGLNLIVITVLSIDNFSKIRSYY